MMRRGATGVRIYVALMLCFLNPLSARAETLTFLPEWRPYGDTTALALHGDHQLFGVFIDQNGVPCDPKKGCFRLLHTLTFEPDVRLTDTFRLHARWRPLKDEALVVTGKGNADSFGKNAFRGKAVERAFIEARLAGFDLAVGQVPLIFHNLYMAEDDVNGILLAKNNLSLFAWPNIRVLFFGTVMGNQSGLTGSGREGQNVGFYGVDTVVDTREYTFEGTAGYLHHAEVGLREEQHIGLSVIRLEPMQSHALRFFGTSRENRNGGQLVMEHTRVFDSAAWDRPTLYVNLFYGTSDYQSALNGSLKNLGFLFNAIGGVPQFDNTGIDAYGGAAGFLLGTSRDFTVTPEIGVLSSQSAAKNAQYAFGVRTQGRLWGTSFLRLDLVSLHQKNKVHIEENGMTLLWVNKF